ncbi:hypothetical protein DTV22_08445 [Salmonella enterica subsp. enterica serovar Kandla]|nr:hypothetical protein [Salmonella enterica subsp. enterica serovar Kandla]EBX9802292.1 hypothetical protein [Salmonella enterica subsp. enterica serovar Kandla]EBY1906357.1 hypothetical protein [Salmonella enterica subsp. enterica serovar Kandla]ECD3785602.1 hypothetical protein [Salmonella enterica subsp. enterica serovar Kandla]
MLNENSLKEKIISLNIFCSISTYSRINVRRWRKNLMSRNIDSQQALLLVHIPPFCQAILERHPSICQSGPAIINIKAVTAYLKKYVLMII